MTYIGPSRIAALVLACMPCVVYSVPTGELNISWGHGPVVPIHGPGIAMAMEVVPLLASGGGSWLPTPNDTAVGFNKNSFYTFCTDAGVPVQSQAAYAARSFADLGATPNPGVYPPWRTDSHGLFLSAIEDVQFLYIHNYATVFPVVGSLTTVDPVKAAGLQLAIWNVLYDNDRDIYHHAGDTFYADQAWNDNGDEVRIAAQQFLDAVPADGSAVLSDYLSTWLDPRLPENGYPGNPRPTQGLIFFKVPGVPEASSTFGLLMVGVAGLSFMKRFSRRLPRESTVASR